MKHLVLAAALVAALTFARADDADAQALPVTITATPASSDGTVPVALQWSSAGASTCTASGAWSGTKAASGSQQITPPLTASRTFTLTCSAPGSATLEWTPPTLNTNGTALNNLAGYRVVYGMVPTSMTQSIAVSQANATGTVVPNLAAGTWHFSVHAINGGGTESAPSVPVAVVNAARSGTGAATHVVNAVPQPPTNVTVRATEQIAYEIRPNARGELVATRMGVLPLGSICSAETRIADRVTYNRVDERSVDLVNWPAGFRPIEAWARCG